MPKPSRPVTYGDNRKLTGRPGGGFFMPRTGPAHDPTMLPECHPIHSINLPTTPGAIIGYRKNGAPIRLLADGAGESEGDTGGSTTTVVGFTTVAGASRLGARLAGYQGPDVDDALAPSCWRCGA